MLSILFVLFRLSFHHRRAASVIFSGQAPPGGEEEAVVLADCLPDELRYVSGRGKRNMVGLIKTNAGPRTVKVVVGWGGHGLGVGGTDQKLTPEKN